MSNLLADITVIGDKIKINKNDTYQDVCLKGKRPRICFKQLQKQLKKDLIINVFNGYLEDLKNN